jgi:trimeric autotransporter adhesin
VANPGTVPLTGAKLQMTIPVGTSGAFCTMDGGTRVSATGNCSAGTIYEWDFGTVSAGSSVTVTPTIVVGSGVTAPLVTSVRAVGDTVNEQTATVTTIVDATAPLQLTVADGPDPAAVGDVLGYTIRFGNRGTGTLPSATLTATVPPGTVLDPASVTDGGTVAGGVITWPLGNLNPGGVGQRTFSVTIADLGAADPGTRHTTAEVRDATLPQPISARASAITVVEAAPALQLVLDTTLDPVQRGTYINYALTATNLGTVPLTGVTLRLKIPNGSSGSFCLVDGGKFIEGSGNCAGSAVYEWTLGTLGAGASASVNPSVLTSSALNPGSLLDTVARVMDDSGRSARAAISTIVDTSPPLQLAITDGPDPAAAGEVLGYTITFGNRGTASLPSTTLTATVPPGTTLNAASVTDGGTVAGGVITWPLGNLSPATTGQRAFTVTVTDLGAADPGTRQTTAELHDTTLPQPTSARASAVTVVEEMPALQLVLHTTLDPVQRGTAVGYQLTATNLGTAPLTGVTIRLKIPNGSSGSFCVMDGGTFVEGSGGCAASAVYEWTIGPLGAGASVTKNPSVPTSSALSPGSVLTTIARVVDDGGRSARAAIATRITQ